MDIHVGRLYAAALGVDQIFADDISAGPVRGAPEQLLQVMRDWPKGAEDGLISVTLQTPLHTASAIVNLERDMGRNGVLGFTIEMHRVQLFHAGKFVGRALRMSALSLSTLAAWEEECARQLRRVRQLH